MAFFLPVIQKKVQVNRIPFTIDVAERAHQIPLSPHRPPRTTASGIREPVNVILIALHRCVFPRPDNAPTVVNSTLINASLKPMMIRYSTAIAIASGSWKKHLAIVSGKKTKAAVIRRPHAPTQSHAAIYPLRILSFFPAP